MARRFFSGNSLEQAILQAASHYGLDPEQVAYSVREKKHGFVNVRRRAVIEVDPEAPEKAKGEAAETTVGTVLAGREATESDSVVESEVVESEVVESEVVESEVVESEVVESEVVESEVSERDVVEGDVVERGVAEDNSEEFDDEDDEDEDGEEFDDEDEDGEEFDDEDEDDFDEDDDLDEDLEEGELDEVDAAYEKAVRLLIQLIDLDLDYSIEEEEGTFFVEFYGPDSEDLLEDDGEALRAIGHLLPRLVRGLAGESWPCKVDCEGFEEARIQELEELAERVAEEVRNGGQATLLESMNPADRRVVHLALAEDPAVETYSEGDGFMKRVKIMPV